MTDRLLVLGHAADRTGPPGYVLSLLRWLAAHRPDVEVDVALLAGGEMLAPLEELAQVTVFEPLPQTLPDLEQELVDRGRVDEGATWARLRALALREMMAPFADHRIGYVNAAPAIELALALPRPPEVLLSHVHELSFGLVHRLDPMSRHLLLVGATRIFSVAEAVTEELVRLHGRDPDVIELHREMIDVTTIQERAGDLDRAAERRARGIDPSAHVVVACGTTEARKGTDLFLELAWHLDRSDIPAPLSCVWVGGDDDGIARARARAAQLGVDHVVHFVGPEPEPPIWFAIADAFVLPSRDDPFPLVCIEAAAVGTPIVAFATGGIPELLEQGCGVTIPYPDVAGMARATTALLLDEDRRRALGDRGRVLVAEQHDVSVVAPGLWDAIARWM